MRNPKDYRAAQRNSLERRVALRHERQERKARWLSRTDNHQPWAWKWKRAVPRPA